MLKKTKTAHFWTTFLGVIAILILIIFIVLIITPIGLDDRHNQTTIPKAQIEAYWNLLTQYFTDTGYYPSTSEGLEALIERPPGPAGADWNGPYMSRLVKDPWGNDYNYESPGVHNPDSYDLWSYGADGKNGGEGKDADIGNW